ncbi:hypothetical protein QYF50_18730 [Paenibacillus vini]|uniref:hypothetical protein n=1 Tax=Paenibacillus vini TaxID=1476024 RepID=UPI0025B6DD9E|nr:hypothetical protein [Paenibacillus vini]MDN4069941.1 hypothetical protein [Paenibacillus vini]
MTYTTLKKFNDRESGKKFLPGQPFHSNTQERIELLLDQGFIGEIDEDDDGPLKHVGAGYFELPNGEKVRGRENAEKALKALQEQTGDDADAGEDQKDS